MMIQKTRTKILSKTTLGLIRHQRKLSINLIRNPKTNILKPEEKTNQYHTLTPRYARTIQLYDKNEESEKRFRRIKYILRNKDSRNPRLLATQIIIILISQFLKKNQKNKKLNQIKNM